MHQFFTRPWPVQATLLKTSSQKHSGLLLQAATLALSRLSLAWRSSCELKDLVDVLVCCDQQEMGLHALLHYLLDAYCIIGFYHFTWSHAASHQPQLIISMLLQFSNRHVPPKFPTVPIVPTMGTPPPRQSDNFLAKQFTLYPHSWWHTLHRPAAPGRPTVGLIDVLVEGQQAELLGHVLDTSDRDLVKVKEGAMTRTGYVGEVLKIPVVRRELYVGTVSPVCLEDYKSKM